MATLCMSCRCWNDIVCFRYSLPQMFCKNLFWKCYSESLQSKEIMCAKVSLCAGVSACTIFLKMKHWRLCSLVNFSKFFWAAFKRNTFSRNRYCCLPSEYRKTGCIRSDLLCFYNLANACLKLKLKPSSGTFLSRYLRLKYMLSISQNLQTARSVEFQQPFFYYDIARELYLN